jgi:hypothetical protein
MVDSFLEAATLETRASSKAGSGHSETSRSTPDPATGGSPGTHSISAATVASSKSRPTDNPSRSPAAASANAASPASPGGT